MLCKSANLRICRGVFLATHVFVSQQNHSTHLGRLGRRPRRPGRRGPCRNDVSPGLEQWEKPSTALGGRGQ